MIALTLAACVALATPPPARHTVNLGGVLHRVVVGAPIDDAWMAMAYGGMADGSVPRVTLPAVVPGPEGFRSAQCGDVVVTTDAIDGTRVRRVGSERALLTTREGRSVNALVGPPVCDRSGRYAVVATPYDGTLTVLDLRELAVVATFAVSPRGPPVVEEGPAFLSWDGAVITVRLAQLPYE